MQGFIFWHPSANCSHALPTCTWYNSFIALHNGSSLPPTSRGFLSAGYSGTQTSKLAIVTTTASFSYNTEAIFAQSFSQTSKQLHQIVIFNLLLFELLVQLAFSLSKLRHNYALHLHIHHGEQRLFVRVRTRPAIVHEFFTHSDGLDAADPLPNLNRKRNKPCSSVLDSV